MPEARISLRGGGETTLPEDAVLAFERSLRGRLILPGGPDYDEARRVWNGLVDKRPGMIVRCQGAADVVACVNLARERGLKLAVRGGGHNVAGSAMSEGGLTIDLSLMRSVQVNPNLRSVRAEGGALLGDIDHEAQAFGLAAPVGLVSATGAAGLTLHGGMGWMTRKRGLTIDNLLSVDIVAADGRLRRASQGENPDLFWAVRGGGGAFGVVTAFEYALYPVGPEVWFAVVLHAAENAPKALSFFRDFMADAPEELGGLAAFWTTPDGEEFPAGLRGKPALFLMACWHGPFEDGERVLAPLRVFGPPAADLSGPSSYLDVQHFFDPEYPDGRFYYWKSLFLPGLPDDAIDTLAAHAATRPSPLTSIDVWFLGGAAARVPTEATAFARRDSPYMLAVESNWTDPAHNEANIAWTREVIKDMRRVSEGWSYLNFPGFAEEGEELLKGAYGENYERLKAVKAKYDPDNLFRAPLRAGG